MSIESVKFFQSFMSQPEELRQLCVDWHTKSKTSEQATTPPSIPARHISCDYVGKKYNEAQARFICKWAKDNPKPRRWDLCAGVGMHLDILRDVDHKKIGAAFSDFAKSDHKLHWVYQEFFGVK